MTTSAVTRLLVGKPVDEQRTAEQLWCHYEVERDLAARLLKSERADRPKLYPVVYDELFRRVPAHPQLTRVADASTIRRIVEEKMMLLRKFVDNETVFLELGAGDCQLSMELAKTARKVYALDVSAEVTKGVRLPPNCELVLSDGIDVPVPREGIDVAYSYQLMEHIHPDDAQEQVRHIYEALRPGGLYICITPNRVAGPHDISKYFETVASGFHLKEYTVRELRRLFKGVGFDSVWAHVGVRGVFVGMSCAIVSLMEAALVALPWRLRHRLANAPGMRNLLLAAVVARKR